MSETQRAPTLVYEIVPEHFGADGETSPLAHITSRLAHLESLGADALCLAPLFPAADAARLHVLDHLSIDPALGTEADLVELCQRAAERNISVFLTGVFDHTSRGHPWFQAAQAHSEDESRFPPEQRTRAYYTFHDEEEHGYACRGGDPEAPELDLRNPAVRRRLFTGEASVLHHWLDLGASGWRILRADAVGYSILRELHRGAMTMPGHKPLIGDIRGFADRYVKDGILDGVVHHYQREAVVAWLKGNIPARQVSRVLRDVSARYGRAQARGWNVLSGPALGRIRQVLADDKRTQLATLLAYTLPGAAHVFYGDEVGLSAGPGEALRMRWNPSRWDDEVHRLHTDLGALRARLIALREGDFVDLTPEGEEEVLAFARVSSDPRATVVCALNRAAQTRVRKIFAPVSDLPDGLKLRDALDGPGAVVRAGTVTLEMPGQGARVLIPDEADASGARFFRGY